MGRKGGSTTNVSNTGLGDSQYASLQAQNEALQSQVNQGQQNIANLQNTVNSVASRPVQDNTGDFRVVNSNIDQTRNILGERIAGVDQNVQQVGNTAQNIDQNVSRGFASMDDQFGQVGQQLTGIGNDVNQGFLDANQVFQTGIGDVRTGMNDGFNQASQERMAGFTGVADMVGSGFAGQADYLQTMSGNILGGQASLNDLLANTGQRLDTYYGDLAQGQAGIANQVGGVQTGLNDFTQQYTTDTALADRTRNDIQTGMMAQTDRIANDIGRMQDANSVSQSRLMDAVGGVGSRVDETIGSARAGFANTLASSPEARGEFASQINTVRQLLATVGQNLDGQTQSEYQDLISAFDPTGGLVPTGLDAAGMRVSRQLDQQGNLLINRSDSAGNLVNRRMLSIPRMISQAQQYQQAIQGTPSPTSGFASPFASTV